MEEMSPIKNNHVPSITEVIGSGQISRKNGNKYIGSLPCIGLNGSKTQLLHVLPFPIVPRNEMSAEEAVDSNERENIVTLPSRLAIPVGIAQIVVGGSMVCCGTFALRYQSYLFYYGSGLWAGLLAGLAGILAVMATKTGLRKPRWLCGGRKWQIRIFLAAVIMALAAAILTAIFSTTGLVRDTQYDYSKRVLELTPDEKMYEKRKSAGIAITAILLLLAVLQILLCFCSLGITLRVLCINSYHKRHFLIRDSSDGSDMTKKEITGQEYEAKTDRLLCWLGYQKRQYLTRQVKSTALKPNRPLVRTQIEPRLHPRLIPVRAPVQIPLQQYNSRFFPNPCAGADPRSILTPQTLPPLFPFRSPLIMSLVPFPIRRPRSVGSPSVANSSIQRCKVVGYSLNSLPGKSTGNALLQMAKERSREDITEEEVEKTYTGLDREIAEKFISNTMNSH